MCRIHENEGIDYGIQISITTYELHNPWNKKKKKKKKKKNRKHNPDTLELWLKENLSNFLEPQYQRRKRVEMKFHQMVIEFPSQITNAKSKDYPCIHPNSTFLEISIISRTHKRYISDF